jgi:simple sugar transport system ATP-binding protein
MSDELMELRSVSKAFGGISALDDVSLSLRGGEILCIAGQNGSGKSTLIKVMSGVHKPDSGAVRMEGNDVTAWTPRSAIDAGVQVIYQDFSLFKNLTVGENLALSALLHEGARFVTRGRVLEIAKKAIDALRVDLDLDKDVGSLPVAGKQLVAIARALMSSPKILIMDEPTTALTALEVAVLFRIVRDIRAQGVGIIFISHKMREMLEISDRITVLRNGRVAASGPAADFDEMSITRAMTGLDHQADRFHYAARPAPAPRLEVRDLSLDHSLSDISFQLMPGEIAGVCGLLGAGRTELALTLFGMRRGYRGAILIDGKPVELRTIRAAVRHGIGYVPEDRLSDGLFFGRSIRDNILAAAIGTSTKLRVAWPEATDVADDMRQRMQVNATGDRPVQELSGGNQQRVVLGRWLITDPRILVLNGPTVGVDVGAKAEIHRIIRQLAADGLAVLMISDDVPELLENCNRLMTMHNGRIVETFEPGTLREGDISRRLGSFA